MPNWDILGVGGFNVAYVNKERTLVFKVPKTQINKKNEGYIPATDLPKRSVRLWNEINKDYPPPAKLHSEKKDIPPKSGWICPFIKGEKASDKDRSIALLDIFNRTGRIVVDAYVSGNFIKDQKGKVVCIDIGMALQLQEKENAFFSKPRRVTRRLSKTSIREWKGDKDLEGYKTLYGSFPILVNILNPDTVNMTKALLFIKANRPDIFNVDFLKSNEQLIKQLASAYDKSLDSYSPRLDQKKINEAIKSLLHEVPITIEQLKESCKVELERYINSRGSLDAENVFSSSLITTIFRNRALTQKKVGVAQELISKINTLNTEEEIKLAFDTIINKSSDDKEVIAKDFQKIINKCSYIIDSANELNLVEPSQNRP